VSDPQRRKALYEAFRSKAIEPKAKLLLLNAQEAQDFVSRGVAEGLLLAGVEGFVITDQGAYEPRQDFSNDYADWNGSRSEFFHTRRSC
jgi:hypothetical protein